MHRVNPRGHYRHLGYQGVGPMLAEFTPDAGDAINLTAIPPVLSYTLTHRLGLYTAAGDEMRTVWLPAVFGPSIGTRKVDHRHPNAMTSISI
jgi:hypothetical protein